MMITNATRDLRTENYVLVIKAGIDRLYSEFPQEAMQADLTVGGAFKYAQGCIEEISNLTDVTDVEQLYSQSLTRMVSEVAAIAKAFKQRQSWLIEIVTPDKFEDLERQADVLLHLTKAAATYYTERVALRPYLE